MKKNKSKKLKILIPLIAILVIVLVVFIITLNNRNDSVQGEDIPSSEPGVASDYYIEEDEDAQNKYVQHDASDFVGTWTATSSQTEYIFGNVDLSIQEDGSWSGSVADTQLKGTWKEADEGIRLHSTNFDYIYYTLSYTDGNVVVLRRDDGAKAVIIKK